MTPPWLFSAITLIKYASQAALLHLEGYVHLNKTQKKHFLKFFFVGHLSASLLRWRRWKERGGSMLNQAFSLNWDVLTDVYFWPYRSPLMITTRQFSHSESITLCMWINHNQKLYLEQFIFMYGLSHTLAQWHMSLLIRWHLLYKVHSRAATNDY